MEKFIYTLCNFRIFFLLFLFFVTSNQLFAVGSLITSRNYYFFQKPSLSSKKYYIPRYQIFEVLDLHKNTKGEYFFLIEANVNKKIIKGEGFILANDNFTENKTVELFLNIPKNETEVLNYYLAPTSAIQSTKERIKSKIFPFLVWQKVIYNFDLPEKVWAADNNVIYRINQSTQWLDNKLKEIFAFKIKKNKRNLILAGQVSEGFSKNEVMLTLGNPINIQKKLDKKEELEYKNQKILLENNQVIKIIKIQ